MSFKILNNKHEVCPSSTCFKRVCAALREGTGGHLTRDLLLRAVPTLYREMEGQRREAASSMSRLEPCTETWYCPSSSLGFQPTSLFDHSDNVGSAPLLTDLIMFLYHVTKQNSTTIIQKLQLKMVKTQHEGWTPEVWYPDRCNPPQIPNVWSWFQPLMCLLWNVSAQTLLANRLTRTH